MGKEHVGHNEIKRFAEDKVNLSQEKASKYRQQATRLREELAQYLKEHPNFSLKKMLLSGSLAKGTALKSLNDIDVACYIGGVNQSIDIDNLLNYLIKNLQNAFPNFSDDQVTKNTHSITVSFRGTGLDVDVVPIIYDGDPDWYGDLFNQDNGSFLTTNIPRHLEFIRKRKQRNKDFSQIIRLIKFWIKLKKQENSDFRFKSFMAEMILAKLCDDGVDFSDYLEAMQSFFTYIIKSNLEEQIAFSDYQLATSIPNMSDRVQIIDPVNNENNVANLYTDDNVQLIVEAAEQAGDAIDTALCATTKALTMQHWREVFGSSFSV